MSGAAEELHENPLKVCRRLIYLHRLVGDDVLAPKPKVIRPNAWRVVIVFTFYACCATMSILTYVDVAFLSGVNSSLRSVLSDTPFLIENGIERTAKDIGSAQDIGLYLKQALMPQLLMGNTYSEPGALRGFNTILGQAGFCKDTSTILLTLRRMESNSEPELTTTTRFSPFYPDTWAGPQLKAGSETNDAEDTDDLWGTYTQESNRQSIVPLEYLGYTEVKGAKITQEFMDIPSSLEVDINVKWKYSSPCTGARCGYTGGNDNAGGFVAAIVVKSSISHTALLKEMENGNNEVPWAALLPHAQDMYILLLDPGGDKVVNSTVGTCGEGVAVTNIMRFEDFMEAGFFDKYTASVSTNFYSYNANMQTFSEVSLDWNMIQSGVVEGPFAVDVNSIKLDLLDTYHIFYEVIYILGTAFYFIELFVYKLYKKSYKLFHDIWTWINTLSIVASCLSVAFRFQYGSKNKSFLIASEAFDFELDNVTSSLNDQQALSYLYQVFSAIALTTIWLRVVELLGKTPPRVKLLNMTLIKAMKAMIIYFCYIMVVLVGFWAFAAVHFSSHSSVFNNPMKAFISCFEMLCLNVAPYLTTVGAPLRVAFLFPYFLFSIISVQMFNSIINYAYNRVSEDMEPVFKKLARDLKNKDKNKKTGIFLALHYVKKVCLWIRNKICHKKKYVDDGPSEAGDRKKKASKAVGAAPSVENLLAADKERVEQYVKESDKKKQAGEGGLTICLYGVFAVSYLMFLWLALGIYTNGRVSQTVAAAIFDRQIPVEHPSGEIYYRKFTDISSINDVSYWMRHALPDIIGEGHAEVESTMWSQWYSNTTSCFNNWNCLVSGRVNNGSVEQMIRVTQRLLKKVPNQGLVSISPELPIKPERFATGFVLVPERGPHQGLDAGGAATDREDTDTQMDLSMGGRLFCKRENAGGFGDNGGIVCHLDADPLNMTKQLAVMLREGYFSMRTGAIVVELVAYNGNSNSLVHIVLEFQHSMDGGVYPKGLANSFTLLGVKNPPKGADGAAIFLVALENAAQLAMACGLIYVVLVLYFVSGMVRELRQEIYRKKYNEGKAPVTSILEYFVDVFHTLDAISYAISIVSMFFFMRWLANQMNLEGEKEGDFSNFITFCSNLAKTRKMYQTLSTLNLLCLFMRPLKFFRNDPRMAKLNMTFWLAAADIAWFNVMLAIFFFGFVLFAHIIFGTQLYTLSTLIQATIYCFKFLIGTFDFWELWAVSNWSATFFVFFFLFLFKFFFLNIFFAIIDKFFVSGDAPPMNLRKNLKPILGRLCRWIEWDRSLVMEGDLKAGADGPPSRSGRVHLVAQEIHEIRHADPNGDDGGVVRKSKTLSEVCEVDEKMNEVLRWSKEEAKGFVDTYKKLLHDKTEFSNDEVFLETRIKQFIDKEHDSTKELMYEAERHQRYAIVVNESLAQKDQEVLSKYILRLETKISRKKKHSHALNTDVKHLEAECQKCRYTDEEYKHIFDQDVPQSTAAVVIDDKVAIVNGAPDEDDEPDDDDAKEDEAGEADKGNTAGDLLRSLEALHE